MDWLQVLSLFLANAGLILWFRSESRADWKKMDEEFKEFRYIMFEELKDFHGRLCDLEARRK